jgi:NADH dehydrogenase/NADH:ubiquinone oxidoreductase subunit G
MKLRLIDDHLIETDGAVLFWSCKECRHPYPYFMLSSALEPYGSCRLCSVEIEKGGRKGFFLLKYPVEDRLVVGPTPRDR